MDFLNDKELNALVQTIQDAEDHSTGEIRVHIDSNTVEDFAEVAMGVFHSLNMTDTKERNGVLIYINFEQKYLTIIGDEGIHAKVKQSFWDRMHDEMTGGFAEENYFNTLNDAIVKTGQELKKYFPIDGENPNELPNEITFS